MLLAKLPMEVIMVRISTNGRPGGAQQATFSHVAKMYPLGG
jgi:hypothetical protein